MLKRILLAMVMVVVIAQLIRPDRTTAPSDPAHDVTSVLDVPDDVQTILRASCYDCHSNATMYPWYAEIQPVGWWLNSHISDARRELNFSEFGMYQPRRQYIKLQQIVEEVTDDEMPLPSYLIMHNEARLSQEQKAKLVGWATDAQESMRARYPPEDLERSKRD